MDLRVITINLKHTICLPMDKKGDDGRTIISDAELLIIPNNVMLLPIKVRHLRHLNLNLNLNLTRFHQVKPESREAGNFDTSKAALKF